jgi:hypothetical protein
VELPVLVVQVSVPATMLQTSAAQHVPLVTQPAQEVPLTPPAVAALAAVPLTLVLVQELATLVAAVAAAVAAPLDVVCEYTSDRSLM